MLGTDDAAATEAAVRDRAAAHGLRSGRAAAVSRLLMVGVVVAALGAMAALLLSAAHVIHF